MTARISPAAAAALSQSARPALELEQIGFCYGERRALDGVSLTINERELFGLLGPNGGGKTTLFKLLSTLTPMQAGSARVLGVDLRHGTLELRRRMGVVFQHPSVDGKLTVTENLHHHGRLYGLHGASLRDQTAAMLERVGLQDRAGELVERLSGGLRRRVELAKALLPRPELLILDEPSTGLDPLARREFLNYLTELRERDGLTIVLTTHYLEEAERCDRIAILDQGKLVTVAPPGELKSRVGGDVVVIRTGDPEGLQRKIEQRMRLRTTIVDGMLRLERPRGHELVRDIVEAFGSEIDTITLGKPTLEDVFVHLTGRRFA
ncbi:MAG TPA: ATP-binding cassette domain-containing protein [Candidatus Binataceae bacterium]|nr:ATP-binding cassette domain-containing protein [Candidatus Binataceae bacterium]